MSLTLIRLIQYFFRAAICNLESWLARRFINNRDVFFPILKAFSFPLFTFLPLLVLQSSSSYHLPLCASRLWPPWPEPRFHAWRHRGSSSLLTAWEWRPGWSADGHADSTDTQRRKRPSKCKIWPDKRREPPPLPLSSSPSPLPPSSTKGSGGVWWLKPQLLMTFRFFARLDQSGRRDDQTVIVTSS